MSQPLEASYTNTRITHIVPDFRSPNTGLYANLARLNLPYAEAVFDISYFRKNPEPFYVLAKDLYPGNYSPTISHVFIALLAKKNLLRMLFTQNIDCLEREAGVPGDLIVEAHGSFANQRCIECKTEFAADRMKEFVLRGEVPRCPEKDCDGLVKPDIVFFGESLPPEFFHNRDVPATADLVLIMGTSLTVQPFASLPDMASEDCPRMLFNMERVGTLGSRADDVLALGDCDSNVRKLAKELGWLKELEVMWRDVVGEKEAERQLRSVQEREAALHDEVEQLADRVGAGMGGHSDDEDDVNDLADQVGALGLDKKSDSGDYWTDRAAEGGDKEKGADAGQTHDTPEVKEAVVEERQTSMAGEPTSNAKSDAEPGSPGPSAPTSADLKKVTAKDE